MLNNKGSFKKGFDLRRATTKIWFKKGNHIGLATRFKKGHKYGFQKGHQINNARIPWNKGKHPEYVQGKNNPMYGKLITHIKGAYYNEIWMRSSWEIRVAQLMDKVKIKWQYECKRFELKNMTYCPDFYLPKYNLWIEVKGWMTAKSKERIKQFRELYPDENLLIIDSFLYKKYCKS